MSELTALLELQSLDNTLDQLRYRHEHLPERQELTDIASELDALTRAFASTEATREGLRKRERDLEADATDVKEKAARLDGRLYDGSVTSPKEATTLTEEVASLKARQSELEDQAIELLVEIEPLDEHMVDAEAARGELEARQADSTSRLEKATADLEGEIAAAESERATAAGLLTEDRLEQYRKLRITYGPAAIVEFDPDHSGGCPVAMSAVELDRWKHLPAGTLENCVDCGRLVAKLT
ncbi:MAG: zinc ribbon domain-containing protein [Acidimicrobiales bacterium]